MVILHLFFGRSFGIRKAEKVSLLIIFKGSSEYASGEARLAEMPKEKDNKTVRENFELNFEIFSSLAV